jgi:hypothetical protein
MSLDQAVAGTKNREEALRNIHNMSVKNAMSKVKEILPMETIRTWHDAEGVIKSVAAFYRISEDELRDRLKGKIL